MPDTSTDKVAAYLAEVWEQEQAATKGPWHAEPDTGAGRVWVQIARCPGGWSDADCEPLFNVRHLGQNPTVADYRQREADAAFIVSARNRIPALLAALKAVLGDHGNQGVYLGADECDHPEPSGIDEGWDADHPHGAGDVGRICLLTEIGRYCPACTQLVYEDDPIGDSYVDASNCIVLPAISAALLGEGGDGG